LREKILIGSPHVRVLTYGDDLKMPDWRSAIGKVRSHPEVIAAAPFVLTEAGVSAQRDYATGAYVYGLIPEAAGVPDITGIRKHATAGNFTFRTLQGDVRGAVVGKLLAGRLNAYPSDTIRLVSFQGTKLNPVTGMPTTTVVQLEVTGLFETGMYEYDNAYIYVPLRVAQELTGFGDAVTGLEVRTRDLWKATEVSTALDTLLRFPYRSVDWQEQNRSLFQALKLEKLGMAIILLLIVIVAAFNIVSTLTMVVTDKTREIGILRAMGMTARSIARIFFVQGLVIGVVGTTLGAALGVGVALALGKYKLITLDAQVYFIDHLPVSMEAGDVLLIVAASIAIAAIATIYPARQASRLFPLDAIRHE
jgi:lipoprotein-releasing system permease protein